MDHRDRVVGEEGVGPASEREVVDQVGGGLLAVRNRDGLAHADLAGEHSDGALADAPGDPGDGLRVGGVPVQHRARQVLAEWHAREASVCGQFVYQCPSILSK
ncbi:hypothetical protein [Streptomyces sp. NPDC006739]|uniref:hypothetical protein n=1 Tax=Streptomyces sp. NPDC006739 TaxID=3364763 RepID=UPI00367C5611